MVISRDELEALSDSERAELVLLLVQLGSSRPGIGHPQRRRWFIVFVLACILGLAGWIVTLGLTLPSDVTVREWRLAWIGFDVAELIAFMITGWAAWRGRQIMIPATIVTGTLLLCDAWFDVVLSWDTGERWQSLLSAVLLEVPLAVLFWVVARRLVLLSIAAARSRLGLVGPPPALRHLTLFDLPFGGAGTRGRTSSPPLGSPRSSERP
jgi:hypothetical protein